MKKTPCILVITVLCLLSTSLLAQHKKAEKDSSNTTVIIFNQSKTESRKKKAKIGESNIVKIAPLGLISGTFPISYERRINDFFSVQLSAGLTMRNYSRGWFTNRKDGIDNSIKYTYPWADQSSSDISESIYSFNYRKAKIGYLFSAEPRVYFQSEGLEGPFLGLAIHYYRYNFQIPGMVSDGFGSNSQTGPTQNEYENILDYMVGFGSQTLYDRISLEYSMELGLRNINGSKYAATTDQLGTLQQGQATYKQTLFNFNFGIKVGYHF